MFYVVILVVFASFADALKVTALINIPDSFQIADTTSVGMFM